MQGAAVVKGRQFIEQAAHEADVLHHLFPVVKVFYFRMPGFYDLERRGYECQRIAYLMGDHGNVRVVILKQPGNDLPGGGIFFHQLIHFIDINIFKHGSFPRS